MKREILALTILLVLDLIWIGVYMSGRYRDMIPNIQGSKMTVVTGYAVISYALMAIGLLLFVLPRVRSEHCFRDSLLYGFTFGVVLYGVYDFTAAAVLKNWNMSLAVQDILWGGFVYATAAYIACKLA